MKKIWLFSFSAILALTIAVYRKGQVEFKPIALINKNVKTFIKDADIIKSSPSRSVASVERSDRPDKNDVLALPENYPQRNNRILIGDINKKNYQDIETELEMINSINPNWKDVLGSDLLRLQDSDTQVSITEEYPVIKIVDDKGKYYQQVHISYVFKNGNESSFRALVNSETGQVEDSWDRVIRENSKNHRAGIRLPASSNSGITAH
jgi:hypothetical protein